MKEQFISLECIWQTDKYVLVEKMNGSESKSQEDDGEDVSQGTSAVQYQSIEVLLGGNNRPVILFHPSFLNFMINL